MESQTKSNSIYGGETNGTIAVKCSTRIIAISEPYNSKVSERVTHPTNSLVTHRTEKKILPKKKIYTQQNHIQTPSYNTFAATNFAPKSTIFGWINLGQGQIDITYDVHTVVVEQKLPQSKIARTQANRMNFINFYDLWLTFKGFSSNNRRTCPNKIEMISK